MFKIKTGNVYVIYIYAMCNFFIKIRGFWESR